MFYVISLLAAGLLILIDYLTKYWAATSLAVNGPIALIPNVFEFHYTENRGVAFSMLQGQRWFFVPLSILIAVAVLVILFRSPLRRYKLFSVLCVLIFSGAIGNLIDRIAYGYVVDFLYFKLINFPVFNIADCYVVIGACLMFLFVLFVYKEPEDLPLRTILLGIPKKPKEESHG